jgi:glycosyltransferase involved in cell wall biosynthesis
VHIAIFTRQVTNYHHVRFVAAARRFAACDVLSMANQGKFAQVLSQQREQGYVVHRLYKDTPAYLAAAADGSLEALVFRQLDSIGPDVVAIPGWASPESFAGMKWAKRRGARLVLMSDSQAHDAPRTSLRERIKARIVGRCDAALVAGTPHRDYVVALGMPADRVFLAYDVVDNEHFYAGADAARAEPADHRARLGLPARYILASARFVPKKNLQRLIEAYAVASARVDRPPRLLIAGDGEQRPALEAQVAALGLEGVVLLPGFFGFTDLPALYGLSEGFVHVPTSEQWGLVVNEAAASSLPMVLSRACGAASELMQEGEGGWLADAGNAGAIADALERLMTLTPDQRSRMGAANCARVAHWSPDDFADGLKAAAVAAQKTPAAPLRFFDLALLRALGRHPIETVA